MDKIISARVDEQAADLITALAVQLRTSKKSVIEQAVAHYADLVRGGKAEDVFARTSGAWARRESPEKTVAAARKAFSDSMNRRRKP